MSHEFEETPISPIKSTTFKLEFAMVLALSAGFPVLNIYRDSLVRAKQAAMTTSLSAGILFSLAICCAVFMSSRS